MSLHDICGTLLSDQQRRSMLLLAYGVFGGSTKPLIGEVAMAFDVAQLCYDKDKRTCSRWFPP